MRCCCSCRSTACHPVRQHAYSAQVSSAVYHTCSGSRCMGQHHGSPEAALQYSCTLLLMELRLPQPLSPELCPDILHQAISSLGSGRRAAGKEGLCSSQGLSTCLICVQVIDQRACGHDAPWAHDIAARAEWATLSARCTPWRPIKPQVRMQCELSGFSMAPW